MTGRNHLASEHKSQGKDSEVSENLTNMSCMKYTMSRRVIVPTWAMQLIKPSNNTAGMTVTRFA